MQGSVNEKNSHARHLAYQIVAQLPEKISDALLVLEYAKRLLQQPIEQIAEPTTLKLVEKQGRD